MAQSSYHLQPTQSDSFNHANYLSLSGSFSAIGRDLEDNTQIAQFKYHHAGKAGQFQYFAGLQLNAGAYNFDRYGEPAVDAQGNKFPQRRSNFVFSGAVSAGASFVLPIAANFDWRVVGVEGNWGIESGRYYQYRKAVPDSLVAYVDRRRLQDMYFLTTELVFRRRRSGMKFGYQFAVGSNFTRIPYSDSYYYSGSNNYYDDGKVNNVIVRNTLHFNRDPVGYYFQVYGGRYLATFNTGITYRLSHRAR
ncbi:MAG: hypothetical protein QM664_09425 [Flavihumibacter sp.]